jgi:hypothetical protein
MSRRRSRGGRRLTVALASALAAFGVAAAGASSASAADATFNEGYLKINLPDPFHIITTTGVDASGPVILHNFAPDGQGDFTVAQADVEFPPFTGELFSQPLTVSVSADADVTGNYNAATGTWTGDSSAWKASIDFAGSPCAIGPFNMTLGTATNAIFEGDAFDAASNPPTGGAVSSAWTGLPAGTGAGCALIDSADNGPGGLWLGSDIGSQPTLVPPPPATPAPTATTPPAKKKAKKKCKKKKKKGKSASAAKKKKGCKKKKKKKKK